MRTRQLHPAGRRGHGGDAARASSRGALAIVWGTLLALSLPGCSDNLIECYPYPGAYFTDETCLLDPDAVPGDDATGDTGGGDAGSSDATADAPSGPPLLTGTPCEQPADCELSTCLTTSFLTDTFGLDGYDVPGGMCTEIFCDPEDTEVCGPEAACVNAGDFIPDANVQACFRLCESLIDCRWQQGWTCHELGEGDQTVKLCLPDAIVAALLCDQQGCDPETGEPSAPTEEGTR